MADQPIIFISYHDKDEQEKDQLLGHLGVLQEEGLIELWSNDRIGAGEDWRREISQVIDQAKVAILLVTANFLTSNFILKHEVPELLKRRQNEGLIIFPVIAKHCSWQAVEWLARMEVRPKSEQAIWGAADRDVDEKLVDIAQEIVRILGLPIYRKDTESLKSEDIDVIVHRLEDWKTIHTTTQNLLLSMPSLLDAVRKFQNERTETRANDIQDIWFQFCEPKAKKIRRDFKEFKVVRHKLINELYSMVQGSQYVIHDIHGLKIDDQKSLRKLQSSIYILTDTLKEVLTLADLHIIEIAEELKLQRNKGSN